MEIEIMLGLGFDEPLFWKAFLLKKKTLSNVPVTISRSSIPNGILECEIAIKIKNINPADLSINEKIVWRHDFAGIDSLDSISNTVIQELESFILTS